jgi:site-specific recombinase XerD
LLRVILDGFPAQLPPVDEVADTLTAATAVAAQVTNRFRIGVSPYVESRNGLKGLRDRALLLLGFAGAFRRSELVSLNCEDIEESETGIKITIRHSKTDQEGQGATIGIMRGSIACPVEALRAWREAADITTGPLFRSIRKGGQVRSRLTDQSVSDIVKTHAARVGLDPAVYAGHSLRAGFLTSAAKRGASILKMMDVSRHRSVDTLRGYVRDAEIFKDHAGAGLL